MTRAEFACWEAVKVRWSDMDAMGHVNNARYFTYLECARIQFFESMRLRLLDEDQLGIALVSVSCNFRRQVRYPATLDIGTRVTKIGASSFHLAHAFFLQGQEECVADAASVVVCVDYAREQSVALPEGLRRQLEIQLEMNGTPSS